MCEYAWDSFGRPSKCIHNSDMCVQFECTFNRMHFLFHWKCMRPAESERKRKEDRSDRQNIKVKPKKEYFLFLFCLEFHLLFVANIFKHNNLLSILFCSTIQRLFLCKFSLELNTRRIEERQQNKF